MWSSDTTSTVTWINSEFWIPFRVFWIMDFPVTGKVVNQPVLRNCVPNSSQKEEEFELLNGTLLLCLSRTVSFYWIFAVKRIDVKRKIEVSWHIRRKILITFTSFSHALSECSTARFTFDVRNLFCARSNYASIVRNVWFFLI